MNFKTINMLTKAAQESIIPEIHLQVEYEYQSNEEVLVTIDGTVKSEDNKVIAHLQPYFSAPDTYNYASIQKEIFEKRIVSGYTRLSFELSEKALDHISEIRQKKGGDVNLNFNFRFRYLCIDREIGIGSIPQQLQFWTKTFKDKVVNIPQSTWVKEYLPNLAQSHTILLEMPKPDFVAPENHWQEMLTRMSDKIDIMGSYLERGDWQSVMNTMREFIELIRSGKPGSPDAIKLKQAFKDRNRSDEGFDKFYESIQNLFDYTSKFIHERGFDKSFQDKPVPHKEDADFAYHQAITFTKLLLAKLGV